ncbi:hypothetical protein [Paenibacillus humicus]|uniref:hypothetical protein n=1 Tax=Paenibacillus humicus TaxID=412861 RepID=UPI003F13C09B
MKPFVWKEGMSVEETKNGAYWERNMLALMIATIANESWANDPNRVDCGWYTHGEYEGWARVISLFDGKVTFHVPDDFDLGKLQQIEPNWDGHTTEQKWNRVMNWCGIQREAVPE